MQQSHRAGHTRLERASPAPALPFPQFEGWALITARPMPRRRPGSRDLHWIRHDKVRIQCSSSRRAQSLAIFAGFLAGFATALSAVAIVSIAT